MIMITHIPTNMYMEMARTTGTTICVPRSFTFWPTRQYPFW